ncbi:MAG: cation diffusion facilitator family transporter [Planctomycetota bacterium]|jgi:cation diffusion facilitator family transporter
MPEKQKCIRCAAKLSWIGLWDSVFLALFKGVIGILTGSRALTASALYSLHDVISGVAVIIGLKIAARPADEDHPYGHGNAEYIVCVLTSIIILGATIFLLADCIRVIFMSEHAPPHWAALAAAVISVFANEVIYRFNICAYKHMNSPALLAHAKHHRADVISSLAVVVAIIAGAMGYRFIDALVAIFEAGHLFYLSAELLYQGGSGLIDHAIKESDVSLIKQLLAEMPDVEKVRDIKTRQIGRYVWVDLYLALPPNKTIAEVKAISGQIRHSITGRLKHTGNVNVICE